MSEDQLPQVSTPVENNEKKIAKPIQANEQGQLVGSTFEDQYRLARAYYSSGMMPKTLNSPEKVLVAVQICRELNLPPMNSLPKIAVINGSASLFGDLPLALVMRSGLLEAIEETWLHDPVSHEVVGAICKVRRKGLPGIIERKFTIEEARQAGLATKDVWKAYKKRMLQFRARSWALKDAFPDVLMGASILEYDHNATTDPDGNIVGAEVRSIAEELNSTYANEEKKIEGPETTTVGSGE